MHFKLIVAMVEDEKTEAVLEAAREAGATGATVLNQARGEGLKPARTFFGLSIESQREAERLLVSLAKANQKGIDHSWEFNEWLHGASGNPMGFGLQGWSAAMYLYAEHAVETGRLPLFDDLLAAKPAAAAAAEIDDFGLRPGGGPA